MDEERIIIGIGLAHDILTVTTLLPGKNTEPTLINAWPGAEDSKLLAVPLRVDFQPEHSFFTERVVSPWGAKADWGYSAPRIPQGMQRLLLLTGANLSDLDAKSSKDAVVLEALSSLEAKTFDVTLANSDGIGYAPWAVREIVAGALEHVTSRIGRLYSKDVTDRVAFDLSVSLPPWWDIEQTTEFSRILGTISRCTVTTVPEPLACLKYYLSKNKHKFEENDFFVHCGLHDNLTTISTYQVTMKNSNADIVLKPKACSSHALGLSSIKNAVRRLLWQPTMSALESSGNSDDLTRTEKIDAFAEHVAFLALRNDGSKALKCTRRIDWDIYNDRESGVMNQRLTLPADKVKRLLFEPYLTQLFIGLEDMLKNCGKRGAQSGFKILLDGRLSESSIVSMSLNQYLASSHWRSSVSILPATNGLSSAALGAAIHKDENRKQNTAAIERSYSSTACTFVHPDSSARFTRCAILDEQLSVMIERQNNFNDLFSANDQDNQLKVLCKKMQTIRTEQTSFLNFSRAQLRGSSRMQQVLKRANHVSESKSLEDYIEASLRHLYEKDGIVQPDLGLVHIAALAGDVKAFTDYISTAENLDQLQTGGDYDSFLPIHCAVFALQWGVVDHLVQRTSQLSSTTKSGDTCLHLAARTDSNIANSMLVLENVLKEFKLANLDINGLNSLGQTALDIAIATENQAATNAIIAQGGLENPRQKDTINQALAAINGNNEGELVVLLNDSRNSFLGNPVNTQKDTLLHVAVRHGAIHTINAILGRFPHILNEINQDGETAMHIALETNFENGLPLLLTTDTVNIANRNGWYAIHLATKHCSILVLEQLLNLMQQSGMNLNILTKDKDSAIHIAIKNPSTDMLQFLITNRLDIRQNVGSWENMTGLAPIHVAAAMNKLDAVKVLISAGASVQDTTMEGCTALQIAVQRNHHEIIQYLLPLSTDLKVPKPKSSGFGRSILSSRLKPKKSIDTLNGGMRTVLHDAAQAGNIELVKLLIKNNMSPNARDEKTGWTPLSHAARFSNLEIIKYLLKHKADPNVIHKDRSSIAHLAAQNKIPDVFQYLKQYGDIRALDSNLSSMIHVAARNGCGATVSYLLDIGVDIHKRDHCKTTPFHAAIEAGNMEACNAFLVANNASIETPINGSTPLHHALVSSNASLVRFFLARDAKISAFNAHGESCVAYVITERKLDMLHLLLHSAPNISLEIWINTAAFAIKVDNFEAFQMLLDRDQSHINAIISHYWYKSKYELDEIPPEGSWTPLHLALWYGRPEMVSLALSRGADPNFCLKTNKLQLTPLLLAASRKTAKSMHERAVEVLLKHTIPVDLGQQDEKGNTALHLAARSQNSALVEHFLERGMEVFQRNLQNMTAVDMSIMNDNAELSTKMIDSAVSILEFQTDLAKSVIFAFSRPKMEAFCVKFIRAHDHLSTYLDKKDQGLLFHASKHGRVEAVQELLRKGADPLQSNDEGETPLDIAVAKNHVVVVDALHNAYGSGHRSEQMNWKMINQAAKADRVAMARKLYDQFNCSRDGGRAIFHWAAQHENEILLRYLIDFGVSKDIPDPNGWPAIHVAAKIDACDTIRLLVNLEVSVDATGLQDRTPLHEAVLNDHTQAIECLLDLKADRRIADEEGNTPLHLAVLHVKLEALKALSPLTSADRTFKNKQSQNIMDLAFSGQNSSVIRQILAAELGLNGIAQLEIHKAVQNNDIDRLKLLVDLGADIDSLQSDHQTPLHLAVRQTKVEIVKFLVDRGANLELEDKHKATALILASFSGKLDLARLLIKAGAKLDHVDLSQYDPMCNAVRYNHSEIVRLLIESGASLAYWKTEYVSPLHLAAEFGYTESIQVLLQAGLSINHVHPDKDYTPLMRAASFSTPECMEFLLAQGAELNAIDDGGWSALHWAANKHNFKAILTLLRNGARTSLISTCKSASVPLILMMDTGPENRIPAEYLEVVQLLIERMLTEGSNLNHQNSAGMTAVHLAAKWGHPDVLQLLISKGANVNTLNKGNGTPLRIAVSNNHFKCVEVLIKAGADVHAKHPSSGFTALLAAADKGYMDSFQALLQAGANISEETTTKLGWRPIQYAAERGHIAMLEFILFNYPNEIRQSLNPYHTLHLAAGAGSTIAVDKIKNYSPDIDLNLRSGLQKHTALHYAIASCQPSTIRHMIKLGASTSVLNGVGDPPIVTCMYMFKDQAEQALECLKALVELGVNINQQGTRGWAALHTAASNGYWDAVKFLLLSGAKPNLQDKDGWTALACAVKQDHVEALAIFHKHNAHFSTPASQEYSLLQYAVICNGLKCFRELVGRYRSLVNIDERSKSGMTALHIAASKNRADMIAPLVNQGASMKLATHGGKGNSAAHLACLNDCSDALIALLDAGCDIGCTNDDYYTPLHQCAFNDINAVKCATVLVERGANQLAKDKWQRTPLMISCIWNAPAVTAVLANCKGSPIAYDRKNGMTCLGWAAKEGHLEVVNVLLAAQKWSYSEKAAAADLASAEANAIIRNSEHGLYSRSSY